MSDQPPTISPTQRRWHWAIAVAWAIFLVLLACNVNWRAGQDRRFVKAHSAYVKATAAPQNRASDTLLYEVAFAPWQGSNRYTIEQILKLGPPVTQTRGKELLYSYDQGWSSGEFVPDGQDRPFLSAIAGDAICCTYADPQTGGAISVAFDRNGNTFAVGYGPPIGFEPTLPERYFAVDVAACGFAANPGILWLIAGSVVLMCLLSPRPRLTLFHFALALCLLNTAAVAFYDIFFFQKGSTNIAVAYPVLGPVTAVSVTAIFFLRRRLVRFVDPIRCRQCGYNLTGNQSGICPECGTEMLPSQDPERFQPVVAALEKAARNAEDLPR